MIFRRTVTPAYDKGITYARATVWTDKGQSSKTFMTASEANAWVPASEAEGRGDE